MAKKTVGKVAKGDAKDYTKVIKMVKSKKSGAYAFREGIVSKAGVEKFFSGK